MKRKKTLCKHAKQKKNCHKNYFSSIRKKEFSSLGMYSVYLLLFLESVNTLSKELFFPYLLSNKFSLANSDVLLINVLMILL
jgi:hypothetical protein